MAAVFIYHYDCFYNNKKQIINYKNIKNPFKINSLTMIFSCCVNINKTPNIIKTNSNKSLQTCLNSNKIACIQNFSKYDDYDAG